MEAVGHILLRPPGTREVGGAARALWVTHPSPQASPLATSLLADCSHFGRWMSGHTSSRCVGVRKHATAPANQSEESRAPKGGKRGQSPSGLSRRRRSLPEGPSHRSRPRSEENSGATEHANGTWTREAGPREPVLQSVPGRGAHPPIVALELQGAEPAAPARGAGRPNGWGGAEGER